MLLRNRFRSFQNKLQKVPAGRLLVFGELEGGQREFGAEELRAIDAGFQTQDISSFKAGFHGRAVRLAGLLGVCALKSGPLYLNAANRDGSKVLSFWLKEIEPLAWIVYEAGNFQLVVPGSSGARESISDLALIEIANEAEPGRLSQTRA